MLSSRAPRKRHKLLHRGAMVRVYLAVVDGAREAQKERWRFDLDATVKTADEALKWLDSACHDAMRMRRLERQFQNPALAGGYDAAS